MEMTINELLNKYWPDWEVDMQIGRGANGTVYKVHRKDEVASFFSAVKRISVPEDSSETENLHYEGYDDEATRNYFKEVVDNVVSEVKLLSSLRGARNVVRIEDYKVIEHEDGKSYDILIRMELLTPLNEYLCDKTLTEKEVVKLGSDLCDALSACHKHNIIHRDIKPENIFVNEFGEFKIGDFGIARQLENVSCSMSSKGTYGYVAPEVILGKNYDKTVDTYSLGLVLYKILNNNRLPFLDPDKQILSATERREATDKRIKGNPIPPARRASAKMNEIILKACEYDPFKRFEDAEQMKEALLGKENPKETVLTENKPGYNEKESVKTKKGVITVILSVTVILGGLAVWRYVLPHGRMTYEQQYYSAMDLLVNNRYDEAKEFLGNVVKNVDYFINAAEERGYVDEYIYDENNSYGYNSHLLMFDEKTAFACREITFFKGDDEELENTTLTLFRADDDDSVDLVYISAYVGGKLMGAWSIAPDGTILQAFYSADEELEPWMYDYYKEKVKEVGDVKNNE